eukprot:Skav228652  [mRNA]  locus=scaffold2369:100111:100581:- [translate_table: standard]
MCFMASSTSRFTSGTFKSPRPHQPCCMSGKVMLAPPFLAMEVAMAPPSFRFSGSFPAGIRSTGILTLSIIACSSRPKAPSSRVEGCGPTPHFKGMPSEDALQKAQTPQQNPTAPMLLQPASCKCFTQVSTSLPTLSSHLKPVIHAMMSSLPAAVSP